MLALDHDAPCAQCQSSPGPRAAVVTSRTLFAELLHPSFSVQVHIRPEHFRTDSPSAHLFADAQVVVIDASVSHEDDVVRAICFRATRQALPIIVIGVSDDRLSMAGWIERGASAFIDNDATLASIAEIVDQLSRGQTIIGVSIRESLLSELRSTRSRNQERFASFEALTRREADVLGHLASGASPEEIARINYVSVNTIRTQIRGILAKLDVTSVVAAVALAYRTGWLAADLAV